MTNQILIVEDEKEIADTLTYAFTSDGMQAHWVTSGAEAMAELRGCHYDLCVLDVGLPDQNGFELLKELRQSTAPNQDLPVIFLTARNEEIDRIVGLEIGADDYVCKPFSPREVVARAKAILKRVTIQPQDEQTLPSDSPFFIDNERYTICLNDEKLPLTRAEFQLLATLLGQPGRVFTRRQLIHQVFSDHHPSDDRVIDTHVKTLRAKLKTHHPGKTYITTHRGFGYSVTIDSIPFVN